MMTRDGPLPLALAAVAIGAVLGAWLRWVLSYWLNPRLAQLPLGTLASNVLGGYIIGIAIAAFAAHPSVPRGSLLHVEDPWDLGGELSGDTGETVRPSLERVLYGPSDDPFGSLNLVGGLRRSMAKAGYSDLKEFQRVGLSVRA